jgi:hypothetical protein
METKRAQTFAPFPYFLPNFTNLSTHSLEALETFIQTQRTLLERTQTDITRLQKLRSDVVSQPAAFVSDLSTQVSAFTFLPFFSSINLPMSCFS